MHGHVRIPKRGSARFKRTEKRGLNVRLSMRLNVWTWVDVRLITANPDRTGSSRTRHQQDNENDLQHRSARRPRQAHVADAQLRRSSPSAATAPTFADGLQGTCINSPCSLKEEEEEEEASTHKSAKTHAGTVFVTCNLDFSPFDPKIEINFRDSSWNIYMSRLVILAVQVLEISCWKNREANGGKTLPPRLPSAWIRIKELVFSQKKRSFPYHFWKSSS